MSSLHMDISPSVATRKYDISSWIEEDISKLSAREKKRYSKRKAAIEDYFTTKDSIEDITLRHHLSPEILLQLAEKCLMQHEDGTPWGYRALLPGVNVVNHAPPSNSKAEGAAEEQEEISKPHAELLPEDGSQNGHSGLDKTLLDHKDDQDEGDTTKRQAVKIPAVSKTGEVVPPASSDSEYEQEVMAAGEVNTVAVDGEVAPVETTGLTTDEAVTATAEEHPEVSSAAEEEHPEVSSAAEEEHLEVSPPMPLLEEVAVEEDAATIEDEVTEPIEKEQDETGGSPEAGIGEIIATNETLEIEEERAGTLSNAPVIVAPPALSDTGKYKRQLVVRQSLVPAVLPLYGKGKRRVDVKKIAHTRRSIRKRWIRDVQQSRRQKRFHRFMSVAVLAAVLFVVLIPVGTGLAAYNAYNTIRGVALDGVNRLLAVKTLLPVSKSDPTAVLDPLKLQQASGDLDRAESDFLQLQQLVNRPDVQSTIDQIAPQYGGKLDMAQRLVRVGIDVSRMGNEMIAVAQLAAGIVHGSPLATGSTRPLVTASDIANIEGTLVHGLYYIDDIRAQMSQVSLKDLPISAAQQKQLASVLTLLPKVQDLIQQGQGVIGIVSWLLGVGQARHFLVQTMDNGELRPSGGFTGQYGILEIQDGRVAPFSLKDVTQIDYNGNGSELGRQAPPAYRSWMRFGNWGLRDSNLSGDYPTTARMSMQVFQEEGGGPVDGDISFTPTFISHILDVVGPIHVADYNETITAQNLADKLHFYQQDPRAIYEQAQKTHTHNASTRKTFTNLLGKLLLDKVRHLKVNQIMSVVKYATKDIQSRDLEIYFTNPLAEAWLVQHSYSGAMDTFSQQDGFMVVQSNISISKASQFVHTTEQDNIVLDAQGGATHNLTITLDYKQTGPVWGFDTYADYIRVYTPPNAQFLGGDGFDTGKALCTPKPPPGGTGGTGKPPVPVPPPTGGTPPVPTNCGKYNSFFPSNARYCPNGNYSLGIGYVAGKGFTNWPVDSLGAPTGLASDLPGHAMWGGMTLTPKNCISYITLQWYVPHEVKHIPGQSPYSILVQKQGGYVPTVQLTVDTSAIKGLKPFSFDGNLVADRLFPLPALKK